MPLSRYNAETVCASCAKKSSTNPVTSSWLWDSEPLRRALSSRDLGAALTVIRSATGLSQLGFAMVLGWNQSSVARAESGERSTLYDIRRLLEVADALDMPRAALIPVITSGDHDNAALQGEQESDMSMNRRELGGTVLGLASAVGLSHMQIPARVDAPHVRYFLAAMDQLYTHDQDVGGGALVRDGLRLYYRARRMLDESDYSETTARQLMSAAGEIAVCAAWLCYDADDQQTASALYSEGHFLASQSGDNHLAIQAMTGKTLQLVYLARAHRHPGYARQAVTLSERATELARPEPCPQLHALLAAREAAAQAAAGDSSGFRLAISRAWREMDKEPTEELPAWLEFVGRPEIATHEARGRKDLGDPSAAADLYYTSLEAPRSPRNEAAARATLAIILADSGDFTGAFAESMAVLPRLDAGKIRSPRIMKKLRSIRQLADQHTGGADFRENYDQLAREDVRA